MRDALPYLLVAAPLVLCALLTIGACKDAARGDREDEQRLDRVEPIRRKQGGGYLADGEVPEPSSQGWSSF